MPSPYLRGCRSASSECTFLSARRERSTTSLGRERLGLEEERSPEPHRPLFGGGGGKEGGGGAGGGLEGEGRGEGPKREGMSKAELEQEVRRVLALLFTSTKVQILTLA